MPVQADIQGDAMNLAFSWIPACAGKTSLTIDELCWLFVAKKFLRLCRVGNYSI